VYFLYFRVLLRSDSIIIYLENGEIAVTMYYL